jgi:hypothetical protein
MGTFSAADAPLRSFSNLAEPRARSGRLLHGLNTPEAGMHGPAKNSVRPIELKCYFPRLSRSGAEKCETEILGFKVCALSVAAAVVTCLTGP